MMLWDVADNQTLDIWHYILPYMRYMPDVYNQGNRDKPYDIDNRVAKLFWHVIISILY